MLVVILLATLSLAVAVQPAQAATCFSGQGFGWRDGHHYVWFVVNMSANNWEVTEPWYVPNANLWAYPDGMDTQKLDSPGSTEYQFRSHPECTNSADGHSQLGLSSRKP